MQTGTLEVVGVFVEVEVEQRPRWLWLRGSVASGDCSFGDPLGVEAAGGGECWGREFRDQWFGT